MQILTALAVATLVAGSSLINSAHAGRGANGPGPTERWTVIVVTDHGHQYALPNGRTSRAAASRFHRTPTRQRKGSPFRNWIPLNSVNHAGDRP